MSKLYHIFYVLYGEINSSENLTLDKVIDYIIDNIDYESMFDAIVDNNEELQQMDEDSLSKMNYVDLTNYMSNEIIECISEYVLIHEYNDDITYSIIYYSKSDGKLKCITPREVISQDDFF